MTSTTLSRLDRAGRLAFRQPTVDDDDNSAENNIVGLATAMGMDVAFAIAFRHPEWVQAYQKIRNAERLVYNKPNEIEEMVETFIREMPLEMETDA